MNNSIDVYDIIADYLKTNGFDGRCNTEGCGCGLGSDFMPCCMPEAQCTPGYKHTHSVTGAWVISQRKEPMSDEEIMNILEGE